MARLQFVRSQLFVSKCPIFNIKAPKGSVLSPIFFTTYTFDFQYSNDCHLQQFSNDTDIVGCLENRREDEYRNLVDQFFALVGWEQPAGECDEDEDVGGLQEEQAPTLSCLD